MKRAVLLVLIYLGISLELYLTSAAFKLGVRMLDPQNHPAPNHPETAHPKTKSNPSVLFALYVGSGRT